jgi:hypothetical protein
MNSKRKYDNPVNVPRITDVRFMGWDGREPTFSQTWKLNQLLREEGVDAAELYGDGFNDVESLSRWATSWGISYLDAAQDARHIEGTRRYMESERQRVEEQTLKANMATILRGVRRG